jgi:hypothetical protein
MALSCSLAASFGLGLALLHFTMSPRRTHVVGRSLLPVLSLSIFLLADGAAGSNI